MQSGFACAVHLLMLDLETKFLLVFQTLFQGLWLSLSLKLENIIVNSLSFNLLHFFYPTVIPVSGILVHVS